jgi:Na+-translocating ferredoxin:NAD+ oxidoreductase subunit C
MKFNFKGGIHPDDNKKVTAGKPVADMPVPGRVVMPLQMHIGVPCEPIVKKGDTVKKGQMIAKPTSFVASPIHASISGTVTEIGKYKHPVFGYGEGIMIESDGKDEWIEGVPLSTPRDYTKLSKEEILEIVKNCGVIGLGGATFPTHIKLNPPSEKKIDYVILNGAECEPYLTSDHKMMLESADKIKDGLEIMMSLVGVDKAYIGVEDNKMDAIETLEKTFKGTNVEIVPLKVRYPQGAEKMLIKSITGKEVPSGKMCIDAGILVHNTGTAIAVSDAVRYDMPLIERVSTVAGGAVKNPQCVRLRIGTLFSDVFEFCSGFSSDPFKIVMGGPMMGFALGSTDVPVIKGVSGILALTKKDTNVSKELPCIRCGRCVEACPVGLVPSMLSILGQKDEFVEEAKTDYNLYDCIECGSCVYVCPSKRNMVQYIRTLKTKNAALAAKK